MSNYSYIENLLESCQNLLIEDISLYGDVTIVSDKIKEVTSKTLFYLVYSDLASCLHEADVIIFPSFYTSASCNSNVQCTLDASTDNCALQQNLPRDIILPGSENYSATCEVCGKQFFEKKKFDKHRRNPYMKDLYCGNCDMKFCSYDSYKQHLSIHSNDFVKCDFCSFSTKYKRNLSRHMKVHAKLCECKHCNKIFSSIYSLQRHVKSVHKSIVN